MPEKFKGKKTEKAGAAVEEEVLLSHIDVCDDNIILDTGCGARVGGTKTLKLFHF